MGSSAPKIIIIIITQRITLVNYFDILLMVSADAKSFGIATHRCTARLQIS